MGGLIDALTETWSAYSRGQKAFRMGFSEKANPYPSGNGEWESFNAKRKDWFDGYFDAKHEAMFARMN